MASLYKHCMSNHNMTVKEASLTRNSTMRSHVSDMDVINRISCGVIWQMIELV